MADSAARAFNGSGLAAGLGTYNQIVIVAAPGTGKTTTLLQVVEAILSFGSQVAAFVPLSEWSSQSDSLLQSVLRRHVYAGEHDALNHLAREGRVVLVLDGWNELDAAGRKRATDQIKALQRDFPDLGIVVSTRRQALDVPLSGPVVEIHALGQRQQMEIARALRGAQGEALLDQAWRTPGIRELVAIPLYLTALLTQTAEGVLPTTKDDVLRLFVTEHERIPDHAEALRAATFGFHADMLIALAVEAMRDGSSTLPEYRARAVIRSVENRLLAERQIMPAQPMEVLDALVNHHTLVRSGNAASFTFHHQQFQEWYASFEVKSLMLAASSGNPESHQRLRAEVLDVLAWEESILFACERLSRAASAGPHAVAGSILEAMTIDPMLAAEMSGNGTSRARWTVRSIL